MACTRQFSFSKRVQQITDYIFFIIKDFPSVRNPKSLSSSPKTAQFNTSLSSTHLSVQQKKQRCWTEGFWVLKMFGPCVELRGSVRGTLSWVAENNVGTDFKLQSSGNFKLRNTVLFSNNFEKKTLIDLWE